MREEEGGKREEGGGRRAEEEEAWPRPGAEVVVFRRPSAVVFWCRSEVFGVCESAFGPIHASNLG